MSKKYKFKSLEIAKKGQEKKDVEKDPNAITIFETGETRTIDFILKDGTRQNFAYAHYMTAWIGTDKDSEKNERYIKIFFATHLITINGYCLDELYDALITFSVKSIRTHDIRYLNMVDDDQVFVSGIKVAWKNSN